MAHAKKRQLALRPAVLARSLSVSPPPLPPPFLVPGVHRRRPSLLYIPRLAVGITHSTLRRPSDPPRAR